MCAHISLHFQHVLVRFPLHSKTNMLTLLSTDMHRRVHQIDSSISDLSHEIRALQTRSAHLEQDLQERAQKKSSWTSTPQQDEALRSLKQELHNRLQTGDGLDVLLTEIQLEIENAEERVKVKLFHHFHPNR